jgi:hypothetical protein
MHFTKAFAAFAVLSFANAMGVPNNLPSKTTPDGEGTPKCFPGQYMCVFYAKDWAGPDEIWTCNALGELVLSSICGGRLCCQDSGSGVKCVC